MWRRLLSIMVMSDEAASGCSGQGMAATHIMTGYTADDRAANTALREERSGPT